MWGPLASLGRILGKAVGRRRPDCERPDLDLAVVHGLTRTDAEDLLDWLEQHGYEGATVDEAEGLFTVRFLPRRPPQAPPSGG